MRQVNLYIPGQNLTNLALNVDYTRLGYDGIDISVNFAVSPAEVTILKGSIFEANGNFYVQDEDYTFTMSVDTHNYIAYDGSTWESYANKGTYTAEKQGFYQADDIHRTARWNIKQDLETFYKDIEIIIPTDKGLSAQTYSKVMVALSGDTPFGALTPILYDDVIHDTNGEYNPATGKFVAINDGWYSISAMNRITTGTGYSSEGIITSSNSYFSVYGATIIEYLKAAHEVYILSNSGPNTYAGPIVNWGNRCYMAINRIL